MSSVLKSIKLLVACIDVALFFNHQGYWIVLCMYSWEGIGTFKAEGPGQMGGLFLPGWWPAEPGEKGR